MKEIEMIEVIHVTDKKMKKVLDLWVGPGR